MLLTLLFGLLSLYLLAFGLLLLLLLLVLFLALRLLLLLLWLRFLLLLLRFRLLLLCRLRLFFLFLRFGLFLLCSRLSLFLMLCWLSALVVVLFLRERRNSRSEKQEQGCCADESEYFHACVLHYQNSAWTRLARDTVEICAVVNTLHLNRLCCRREAPSKRCDPPLVQGLNSFHN